MVIKLLRSLSLISLLFAIFATSHIRVGDPDFWWHLKTGEYIYQHQAIPAEDPFSYTTPSPPTLRVKFILAQYWLTQVLFYGVYQFLGLEGIILFKAFFFTLLLYLLYVGIRMDNVGHYLALGFTTLAAVIVLDFIGERPNMFSFLFALILVCILERFRRRVGQAAPHDSALNASRHMLYPLPFLMILWSNMHGGFILGDVIIMVYVLSEWVQYYHKKVSGTGTGIFSGARYLRDLSIAGGAAIAFSFINPCGYGVIPAVLDLKRSVFINRITEHASPWIITTMLSSYPYWVLVSFTAILLFFNIRRFDITHLILLVFLGGMSLYSIRYIPFFALISCVILPGYLHATFSKTGIFSFSSSFFPGIIDRVRSSSAFQAGFPLIITSFFLIFTLISIKKGQAFQRGADELMFPAHAADFIEENGLKGKMFNHLDVGGYLVWRLYPQQKTFIDGRTFSEEVFIEFDKVLGASGRSLSGLPEWRSVLDRYGIELVVTFSINRHQGKVFPLISALIEDDEWQLIYLDRNSLIFMRDVPANRELIGRFRKPKNMVYDQIILEAMDKVSVSQNPALHITIAEAFSMKKMFQEAAIAYRQAIMLDPHNDVAIAGLRALGETQ
jgi:hypothetical protein